VIEEGYPFIERLIGGNGLLNGLLGEKRIRGKLNGDLPRMGELGPDAIRRCFGLPVPASAADGGSGRGAGPAARRACATSARTPMPTSPIKEVLAGLAGRGVRVMGDIGCYSLGAWSRTRPSTRACAWARRSAWPSARRMRA
jgi:indolepyruvate ferredoxin oxidoreductase alpha subunit